MRNLEKNDFTFGSTLTDKMHSTNYMTSTPTINEPKPDEKVIFKDKKKRRKSINNSSKTLQDIYLINETRSKSMLLFKSLNLSHWFLTLNQMVLKRLKMYN